MQLNMLHAKLHRVTVTQADLNYVGSVTIDRELLDAAQMLAGQRVDIVDVTNGNRLTTYVIVDHRNRIVDIGGDPALVPDGFGLQASGLPRGQQ